MTPEQQRAATAILEVALSERTAAEVASVMALETVLGALERESGRGGWNRRDPELYWFAVFGEPDAHAPWSWRVGGHHVAIHVTLADGQVIGSAPSFLGANPAVVPRGPQTGFRALAGEETLARTLLAGLTPDERTAAIVGDQAPGDILTEHAARADIRSIPVGIAYRDLTATARADLERLIRHYVDRVRPDVARCRVGSRRRRRAGRSLLRVGWPRGARPRPLLRCSRPSSPDRIRQHAERRQPHPRGLARPRQRLGRGPPGEALRCGALRRVTR